MGKTEILAELPSLSHEERREIIQRLIEMEEDAQTLKECDLRANEHFSMLDEMESEDDTDSAE